MPESPALVLDPADAGHLETTVFAGMPGRYTPGEPVAISTLGISPDEAYALVAELGLPLKKATAKGVPDDPLKKTAGLPSDSELESAPVGTSAADEHIPTAPVDASAKTKAEPAADEGKG